MLTTSSVVVTSGILTTSATIGDEDEATTNVQTVRTGHYLQDGPNQHTLPGYVLDVSIFRCLMLCHICLDFCSFTVMVFGTTIQNA